ncbi:hypothetical protein QBC99_004500 [Beijerinckia sp. GAS462]|nr:hypothetical protein [Beijerinckia sp. GAS462]SED20855.1 hypothetical protein SAMN05443249_4735 [Beijerinckia sp. 28-YEA-48]
MHHDNKQHHKIISFPCRRRSPPVTHKMADHIRWLYRQGMNQHDIAAYYGVNQGRVSEVVNNKRFPE